MCTGFRLLAFSAARLASARFFMAFAALSIAALLLAVLSFAAVVFVFAEACTAGFEAGLACFELPAGCDSTSSCWGPGEWEASVFAQASNPGESFRGLAPAEELARAVGRGFIPGIRTAE